MAKLPDHIDKNDKKAVADYFIKQRQLKEFKENIDNLVEREGKGYTFIIGQPREEYLNYLKDNGYIVEYVSHITWQVTKIPLTSESG